MKEISIEGPCFMVEGKLLTREGHLVDARRVCPHGYERANSCRCAHPEAIVADPPPVEEDCQGFLFGLPAATGQVCH